MNSVPNLNGIPGLGGGGQDSGPSFGDKREAEGDAVVDQMKSMQSMPSFTGAADLSCANCGHRNGPHTKGSLCECGCNSFKARTAARTGPTPDSAEGYEYEPAPEHVQRAMRRRFENSRMTAMDPKNPGHYLHGVDDWVNGASSVRDNGDGSYTYRNPYNGDEDRFDEHGYYGPDGHKAWGSQWDDMTRDASVKQASDGEPGDRYQCPDCHGMGMSYNVGASADKALQHCETCGDSGSVFRTRRADSDGGWHRKDFDFTPAPRHASLFDQRIAALHQALAEGQDPLSWLPQSAPTPAAAEKPSGHMTTQVFEGQEGSAYEEATGSEAASSKQASREPDPFA